MCLHLICILVTKLRLGMRTRSKLHLGTWPPSSALCLAAFTTTTGINPWGQQRKPNAMQSRNLCVNKNHMTQGAKQWLHHCKNHSWLHASWSCLPSPFPKRHAKMSQAANKRRAWRLSVLPKMSWYSLRCVPREEVSLLQTSQHLGLKWVGWEQPQGRQYKAAAREWAGKKTQGDSFLWLQREMEKKVSFLPPSTDQHKCKASSVPKRQSIFSPEPSVPPLQHWEPLLPALSEAGCLIPKPCAFLQECPLYPSSLLPSLLSFLTMIPLDPSEVALKWNLRACFGFTLVLGA